MAMRTLFFKENEGNSHNPIGQLSSVPSVPWWTPIGSQSIYGAESCGQLKPSSLEEPPCGGQLTASKQSRCCSTLQGLDKGNSTQFTIFPGSFSVDSKTSAGTTKPTQAAISVQTTVPEYLAHFDMGFGHPLIRAKHPHLDQYYEVLSTYGSQISGRIMLPMSMATDDGPIFVNAKQYHGIIRRRKSRAKAALKNKSIKTRKPYRHYSRHLHAMRRPRGCGGRFLNSKNLSDGKGENELKKAEDVLLFQPSGSQSSAVLQESGTLNTSKETNSSGSNLSGSEVTSMCSRRELDHFPINHLDPPLHFFSSVMDGGHGIVLSSKWVAAADACCNLKV